MTTNSKKILVYFLTFVVLTLIYMAIFAFGNVIYGWFGKGPIMTLGDMLFIAPVTSLILTFFFRKQITDKTKTVKDFK